MLVHSIFESISGEYGGIPQGVMTTFIRFQGCNLSCPYCDTKDSIPMKNVCAVQMSPDEIAEQIQTNSVLITGGEPLLQRELPKLLSILHTRGITIQIETNGTIPVSKEILGYNPYLVFDWKDSSIGSHHGVCEYIDLCFLQKEMAESACIKFLFDQYELMILDRKVLKVQSLLNIKKKIPKIVVSAIDGDPKTMQKIIKFFMDSVQNYHSVVFSLQIHKVIGVE